MKRLGADPTADGFAGTASPGRLRPEVLGFAWQKYSAAVAASGGFAATGQMAMLTWAAVMASRAHFRAFQRQDVDLPASLTWQPEGTRAVRLVNISLGGACVVLDATIDVGMHVSLEVTTPTLWDPLLLPGRIAWIEEIEHGVRRAGMRFEHERPNALRALVEMLGTEGFD